MKINTSFQTHSMFTGVKERENEYNILVKDLKLLFGSKLEVQEQK